MPYLLGSLSGALWFAVRGIRGIVGDCYERFGSAHYS